MPVTTNYIYALNTFHVNHFSGSQVLVIKVEVELKAHGGTVTYTLICSVCTNLTSTYVGQHVT
jgi:hypothetical protein